MHKRKHRMLGRFLSIALAAVLTVTSCYVAPARALADDGSAGSTGASRRRTGSGQHPPEG